MGVLIRVSCDEKLEYLGDLWCCFCEDRAPTMLSETWQGGVQVANCVVKQGHNGDWLDSHAMWS